MSFKKETFKAVVEGQELELALISPTTEIQYQAQLYYNKIFAELLQSGALLKSTLKTYLKKQNLWDDEKQKEYDGLNEIIIEGEKKLSRGNIKLTEAKRIALDIRLARLKLRSLIADMTELYPNTVEGQADNARFNFLVAACLVYNTTGERYYKTVEEYLAGADTTVGFLAATKFAELYYSLNANTEKDLPENKFLIKYKYVNDKLQLVNKDGHLVDTEGRLIDEQGYYIDADGQRIDLDGNPIDENGCYKFDSAPFLDDDGNPVECSE